MQDVGLIYPDGRRALRNINLEARIGEIVAFVGATGAGKTSLAYMVPAFVQASEGRVRIDGVDLKDVAVDSLRAQVSYVFQETPAVLRFDSGEHPLRQPNGDAGAGLACGAHCRHT